MTKMTIEIDETGPDYEPTAATKFYAQVATDGCKDGIFDFGPSPRVAVQNLFNRIDRYARKEQAA